jgi:hypothetical protein
VEAAAEPSPEPAAPVDPERQAKLRAAATATLASQDDPVVAAALSKVRAAEAKTEPNPTVAQKLSGNYTKGKLAGADIGLPGLTIAIENPKGSERSGLGPDGKPWKVEMPAAYGYFLGTKGKDKDHVDVTIGPNPTANMVYVIDQIDPATGKYDEHKTLVGFESMVQAQAAYDASFSDGSGPQRRGAITTMTKPELKTWLKEGDTTKAVAYKPEPAPTPAKVAEPEPIVAPIATTEPQSAPVVAETATIEPKPASATIAQPETKPAAEPAPVPPPAPVLKADDVDVENRGAYSSSARGRKGGEAATVEPAWFRPNGDESLLKMSERLLSDSSPPSDAKLPKGEKYRNSQSYRVTALLDKQTGKVHVVSTFENNDEARVTKFISEFGRKNARDKSVSLTSILKAENPDGSKRFEVLGSGRLAELKEYVNDTFADRETFEREFAQAVEANQMAMLKTAKAQETKFDQTAVVRRYEPADDIYSAEEVDADDDSVVGPADVQPLNLDDEEVELLLRKMPKFTTTTDLVDMVKRGVLPKDLLGVIKKIAAADVEFFARAEEVGTATTLKEYGYEIDTGTSERVEPSPNGRPNNNVPANTRSVPAGARGPAAPVASGQDSPRQAQEPSPVKGAEGNQPGNQEPAGAGEVVSSSPKEINKKTWYHGTGVADLTAKEMDPFFGSHESLMGHGVYLTDNRDIAAGYARARGKKTGTEAIYETTVNVDKVLDLELPADGVVRNVFRTLAKETDGAFNGSELTEAISRLIDDPKATGEQILQAFREGVSDLSHGTMVPTSEFVETFQELTIQLRRLGYDALTHTGGKRTGNAPHRVLILLDPHDSYSQVGRTGQITGFNLAPNLKLNQPEAPTESAPDPQDEQLLRSIHEAAAGAGLDVNVIQGDKAFGAYDPKNRSFLQVVTDTVGRQDVKTAFHEVGHDVFAQESPEVRERLLRAIDQLSDESLGVDLSADSRIRASDPANLGKQALNEERLVEATAERMVQEGFDPAQAKGFAQTFVRALKDLYMRAAMKVQEWLGFDANPEMARRYFENRLKMLLAGDRQGMSYMDFIGAGKPSMGQRHAQWFPSSRLLAERLTSDGLEYDHVPDLSLSAARFNLDAVTGWKYRLPDEGAPTGITEQQVIVEKRAATLNHLADHLKELGTLLNQDPAFAKRIAESEMTPEQFVADLLHIDEPSAMLKALDDRMEPDGSRVTFDPKKRAKDFKHEAQRSTVERQSFVNIQNLLSKAGRLLSRYEQSLADAEKNKERHAKLRKEYLDTHGQTRNAVKEMRAMAKQLFSKIGGLTRKVTVIEQQLKALDPKLTDETLKDYTPAFQQLFTGKELNGTELFDLLDTLANDERIDFSKPITEIRDALLLTSLEGSPYDRLLRNTKTSNALFATVVAFAKTHAREMAQLELRREKTGTKRAAIEQELEALMAGKKDFGKAIAELARNAKIEERVRLAYQKLKRSEAAAQMLKESAEAIRKLLPAIHAEHARLTGKLSFGPEFTFRDGATYNVPETPEATMADLLAKDEGGKVKSARTLVLDSTGQITKRQELEEHLRKMVAFTTHRENKAREGDETALGLDYQTVKRQRDELAARMVYKENVKPAHRFKMEFLLLPVGRKLAEAFGTPVARMILQRLNLYDSAMMEMMAGIEIRGRKTDQLENRLLALMPKVSDHEQLRTDFLNPAKAILERQHELEEAYAGQPEKLKRALYERVKQKLWENEATKNHFRLVAEQAMPILRELLEHQWDTDHNWWLEHVKRGGKSVLEKGIKVFDIATGEYVPAVRRHLQKGAYTFSRRLHRDVAVMVNALNNSDFGSLRDLLLSPGEESESRFLEAYNESPEAAWDLVQNFFAHEEYGSEVQNRFLRPIMEKDGESLLSGPALGDGDTRPPADPALVLKAWNASKGNIVTFAEELFDLSDGTGDKGQFVQETLMRLSEIYHEITAMQKKAEPAGKDAPHAIRGMTADALIDARQIEHLPGQWFDYHSYDRRDLMRMAERITAQSVFGRGGEEFASLFETLHKEVSASIIELKREINKVKDANPGIKPKELEKKLIAKLGAERYRILKSHRDNQHLIAEGVRGLSDYFRHSNSQDVSLNAVVRASQAIAGPMVNNPASSITQMVALADIALRYGAGTSSLKAVGGAIKTAGQELAASLMQTLGVELWKNDRYHRLRMDLGLRDPNVLNKYRDAFDRLEGEAPATHFFRAVNDLMGITRNPFGEQAERVALRPLQPFGTATLLVDRGISKGIWQMAEGWIGRGMQFYRANAERFEDLNNRLDAKTLGLKGAEADSFTRFTADMQEFGLDYEAMVRDSMRRNDGTAFTNEEARRLYAMGLEKVSLVRGIGTTPIELFNNPALKFAAPLLTWSFNRAIQITGMRHDVEGQNSMRALGRAMAGLSVAAVGGLAVSALVEEYYEELLGKKRNLRPVLSAANPSDAILGGLENLNRVGTFGLWGELANGFVNVGTGADNRVIAVDQRVVALSSFTAIQQAISSWLHQGEADYAKVVRPLTMAMGGNGLLQYMQIGNNLLGLDNPESRVTARINAQNYLRVVGRQLDLDVRVTGRGGYGAPTPVSPALTRMELAAYANDAAGFQAAYREAIQAAKEQEYPDPVDHVKRAYAARNPLKAVFQTTPTERDYQRILATLSDDGKKDVGEAVNLFNNYAESIGARGFEGKAEKKASSSTSAGLPKLPTFNRSPAAFRDKAMSIMYAK